jgi:3-phosphoshikimate 1-carboxyvinyltransferase
MRLLVKKTTKLHGSVRVPSSKSHSIRALFFAALAKGSTSISNLLHSEDTQDAINILKELNSLISIGVENCIIQSSGLPLKNQRPFLNSGNSGLTTNFILPLLGLRENPEQELLLDCGEQMRLRPISKFLDTLRSLGMNIRCLEQEGSLPVTISGRLKGGVVQLDGSSSQTISALLIALSCVEDSSNITIQNLHSQPYLDLTLDWLKKLGISYHHEINGNLDIFELPGQQSYKPFNTKITGDFSSAAYLIAAAVLSRGSVEFKGLDLDDLQGDKAIIDITRAMGADLSIGVDSVIINGGAALKGIQVDAQAIPDLVPILAVLGTQAQGEMLIYNAKHARTKETDRIHSMFEGLTAMGARIVEQEDGMKIYQSKLNGVDLNGYGDHRTVMALSIAALGASGESMIKDAGAIAKSFPDFINIMKTLGAQFEVYSS